MTQTYNVHVGLVNWAGSTTYNVGSRVLNSGNCYQCASNGNSAASGGPSGTGTSITDGGVTWTYRCNVDYNSPFANGAFFSANAALPTTFSQNVIWWVWNDANMKTVAAATQILFLSNHTTTPWYLIITPFPGEGFRDSLFLNKNVANTQSNSFGCTFTFPSSGQGLINYLEIHDKNVIVDGFQFVDPQPFSQSTHLFFYGDNGTIQNCLFDGYGQNNGASIIGYQANNTVIKNCLIIDRQANNYFTSAAAGQAIATNGTNCSIYQTGFVNVNTGGNTSICDINNGGNTTFTGCYVFGYYTNSFQNSGFVRWANCATDNASVQGTDLGGNKLSVVRGNSFIIFPTNFGPAQNSFLRVNTSPISAEYPMIDLTKAERANGIQWDIGPIQYKTGTLLPPFARNLAP